MRVDQLAALMGLDRLLQALAAQGYALLDHWQQGEFHHDLVIAQPEHNAVDGARILLVATNCNGGVKEVLALVAVPERWGLWKARCPDNAEFHGKAPEVLAQARTSHWFDPCELLLPDARSELAPAFRRRACGGGWEPST